jgi:hypothetical protein
MLESVQTFDFADAIAGVLNGIATSLTETDWTAIGQNIKAGIVGALGAVAWLVSHDKNKEDWAAKFRNALFTNLENTDWTPVAGAWNNLKTAIYNAQVDFWNGMNGPEWPGWTEVLNLPEFPGWKGIFEPDWWATWEMPDWGDIFKFEFPSSGEILKAIANAIANSFKGGGGDDGGTSNKGGNRNGTANQTDDGFKFPWQASGTRYAQGGMTWVHDGAGPEAIMLPRGAQVVPAGELARTGLPGQQGPVTYNVTIQEAGRNARELADEFVREIERRTRR